MHRGPYEVLGVSPHADQGTIKHAFRDLARRKHPDKGLVRNDADMAEVNNAWAVLNTPEKRAMFDNKERLNVQGVDFSRFIETGGMDILKLYFGDSVMHSGGESRKTPELQVHVLCNSDVLRRGATLPIVYRRLILDQSKYNTAMAKKLTCRDCAGSGYIMKMDRMGGEKRQCPSCSGDGPGGFSVDPMMNLTITIPPGSPERYEWKEEWLGNHVENREPGDVVFVFYADRLHPPPGMDPLMQRLDMSAMESRSPTHDPYRGGPRWATGARTVSRSSQNGPI